jgi:cell division protein FtsZ
VTAPLPVADIPNIPVAAPAPALSPGALASSRPGGLTAALIEPTASDAPLLDLLDRLPPSAEARHEPAASRGDEAPAALNLQACTMDELWLGDFELEDPRRASLVEQISNALKALFRSMTLRLGFGRHAMIAYRGGRTPLPA